MTTEKSFKFCPKCGGDFKEKEKYLLVCNKCDLRYYINPRSCNCALLENEKGEILLVERKHDTRRGYYDFPGGFIDPDETMEQSLTREMKEELKIDIDHWEYLMSYPDKYEYQGIVYDTICFLCKASLPSTTKITPTDDVASVQFFNPKNFPYEMMAFEGMKKALKKIYAK